MLAITRCACCVFVLAGTLWPQGAVSPSTRAQGFLTKGKQLYTQQGPKPALQQFEEALKIFRSSQDRHGEAVTLGYVANCERKLGNLDQALEFAHQALRMKQELGDRGEIGNTQNQLGLIYWERSEYPNAIQHLNDAIRIDAHALFERFHVESNASRVGHGAHHVDRLRHQWRKVRVDFLYLNVPGLQPLQVQNVVDQSE